MVDMKKSIKQIIKNLPFYHILHNWITTWAKKRNEAKEIAEWKRRGRPVPPPHVVKQRMLKAYSTRFGLKTLVETGTCYGNMVEALKDSFDHIYSIELSEELFEKAKERFADIRNVEIIHGDSAVELGKLMHKINEPALFWLDAHYSAGVTAKGNKITPVYEELAHILNAPDRRHVIIIDDARDFGLNPAYPTIEELRNLGKSKRQNLEVNVWDDSIRITPKQ